MRSCTFAAAVGFAAMATLPLAAQTIERFGPHRIEGAARAHSYVLHAAAGDGPARTAISLRCIADEQAMILAVSAPRADAPFSARQTITVWSDKTPATDITLNADPSGAFAVSAMNEQAGLEADAAFMALFEAIISAEEHVSYSVGSDIVTIDATSLMAARTRFAVLCARPSDPGEQTK